MRLIFLTAGVVLVLLHSAPASAQFVQYSPPGDFVSPAEAREATFERAMERARWRFGRLLVDPWIYLNNVRYQENQVTSVEGEQAVNDLTLGFGAGLNTYMTVGADFIWGTFLLPEYTWWQDLDERRRLNGRYGTGLFGNLGKLGVEATVTRLDQSRIFSTEVEQQVSQRTDQGELAVTYDLGKGLLLFVGGRAFTTSSLEDDPTFDALDALDRDETIVRAGIGFRSGRGLRFGIGFESSEVEFDQLVIDRSNSGTSIVFDFTYEGRLFDVNGQAADRSIDPEGNSAFLPYDDLTGALQIAWRPIGPARLETSARKDVAYSIQESVSYIEYETVAAALRFSLGSRGELRLFGEEGENTYLEVVADDLQRIDDRTSFGLGLSISFDRFSWSIEASKDDYESTIPGFDREFTRFGASVTVGGARTSPWG